MKNEEGCLCCRFPHSSRPISLGAGTEKEQQVVDDVADRNGGDVKFLAQDPDCSSSPLESQDHDACPVTDCSAPTFKMKRKKLKPSIARQVAAIAASRAQGVAGRFNPALRQAALQNHVALVEKDEIKCGNLLGAGGFSMVYSVESVDLQCTSFDHDDIYDGRQFRVGTQSGLISSQRHLYTDEQQLRRRLLAQNASSSFQEGSSPLMTSEERQESPNQSDYSHHYTGTTNEQMIKDNKDRQQRVYRMSPKYSCDESRRVMTRHTMSPGRITTTTTNPSRYAIKHLNPELMNFPEKFTKAAIDLACEAEFLLSLDHPHIVKLHGLPLFGSNAYRCGEHHAFFFVMDRMVETLHDRVRVWRQMVQRIVHESCSRTSKEFKMSPKRATLPNLFSWWFPLARCRTRSIETNDQGKDASSDITDRLFALFLERIRVACDIASTIQHIHDRRIIHRDIKTMNIGFDRYGVVKVFDFGLARHLPEPTTGQIDECFCMSNVGTKRYCAPEVNEKRYNLKSDVYSFGVVLWEILALNSPQKPPRQSAISGTLLDTQKLRSCPCWPVCIQRLVFQMQSHDYRQRPTIASVRMTLSSFLQSKAHPHTVEAVDCDEIAPRQGSYRKRIASVDSSHTILDERFKLITSRSVSALIEDHETSLTVSSSLMGMSISATQQ